MTTGKIYVGSSKDISSRWRCHLSELKSNKHHSPILQNSINKYGIENFTFIIIELVEIEKLLDREQFWMDYFESYNRELGYNIQKDVSATYNIVTKEETKIKLSESVASKLDKQKVVQIKELLNQGIRATKIAEIFNISTCHIAQIKLGNSWKHVKCDESGYIFGGKGSRNTSAKLKEDDLENITKLFEYCAMKEIAELYNVSVATIEAFKYGKTWKDFRKNNL